MFCALSEQPGTNTTHLPQLAYRSYANREKGTFYFRKEFADFASIERTLQMKVYFANPHATWQRGANENTNVLLCEFFPKGSDFRHVSNARLARVQQMLNNRPRKCLDYRTPIEVLNALPGVALRN